MSESVQRLRANRPLQGRPCGWCGVPLDFGDPAAVCTACSTATHAPCWDRKGGCPTADCVNRPLARLDEPAGTAALAEVQGGRPAPAAAPAETLYQPVEPAVAKMQCPHCGFLIDADSTLCSYCNMVPTADGIYRGLKKDAPGAAASLALGLVGVFFCGIIFGILAIVKANDATRAMAADPRLGGRGMATAGRILGIVSLVLWGLWMLLAFGGMMAS